MGQVEEEVGVPVGELDKVVEEEEDLGALEVQEAQEALEDPSVELEVWVETGQMVIALGMDQVDVMEMVEVEEGEDETVEAGHLVRITTQHGMDQVGEVVEEMEEVDELEVLVEWEELDLLDLMETVLGTDLEVATAMEEEEVAAMEAVEDEVGEAVRAGEAVWVELVELEVLGRRGLMATVRGMDLADVTEMATAVVEAMEVEVVEEEEAGLEDLVE